MSTYVFQIIDILGRYFVSLMGNRNDGRITCKKMEHHNNFINFF